MKYSDKLNKSAQLALDSIFPRTCPVCDEIVMPRGQLICQECLMKLSFVRTPVCEKCGKEILAETVKLCYDCAHSDRTFIVNRALLNYDENAQKCMIGIKYKNRREHIELFGKMLAYRLGDFISGFRPDCLIPVPVHTSRMKIRGYNQAELLAEVVGEELDIPVRADILIRKKHTEAMKKLNAKERYANLNEAFYIKKEKLTDDIKRVIIIDDIFTTGATIEACSRVFMDEGIESGSVCICIGSDI